MTWFVDASVLVAIVGREDDWESHAARLDRDPDRLWSPISRWESIAGTRSRLLTTIDNASRIIDDIADLNGFVMCPIGAAEAHAAIDAFQRYGRNSAHPARLNMGDCFAYACARTNNARLLYKGEDFSQTDLA